MRKAITEKTTEPAAAVEIESAPEPNLVFVGRREKLNKETGKMEFIEKELPSSFSTPRGLIVLPETTVWGKPFYCEQAEYLKEVFRKDFKAPSFLLGSDK